MRSRPPSPRSAHLSAPRGSAPTSRARCRTWAPHCRTPGRWYSDSADDDFWIRRSALLALLSGLRRGEGDFERFSRYADAMLDEKEFFIRKAIGWVLRDTGRKRPKLVRDWLAPRLARVSGVTLREAVKPLSAEDRELFARRTASEMP
jgi:3-methyladenine DNA glycosylase AlkD